jgi:hypothetical protein
VFATRPTARSVALTLAVVLPILSAGVATAHDHRPPRITLQRGEMTQRGRLGSYCWIRPSDGAYLEECGDSDFRFPPPMLTGGRRLRFVIHRDAQPQTFSIVRWKRVGPRGRPKGEAIPVEAELVHSADDSTWVGKVWIPAGSRHAYLRVFGKWPDVDTAFTQDAEWFFHIQRST